MSIIDSKVIARAIEKIDAEDERARDLMAGGMLQNFSEYRYSAGYRKALQDAKTLLNEALEEIMKE